MNFSSMTRVELERYIMETREKMRKAEMMGVVNEHRVLERQALIAECYLVDLSLIEPGKVYKIISNDDYYFKVEYLKGIFAWGFYVGGEEPETAIPVSMLQLDKRKQNAGNHTP